MKKGKIIFVDTSALFATANAKDVDHQKAKDKAVEYIEKLRNTAEIERVSEEDENHAWQIILRYQDKHFSYVDATSFAVMERLGIRDAFSFDEHFEQYSFNRLPG